MRCAVAQRRSRGDRVGPPSPRAPTRRSAPPPGPAGSCSTAGGGRPAPCRRPPAARRRRAPGLPPARAMPVAVAQHLRCGDSIWRIASSACSALPSWTKPMTALISTTARITAVSIQCPSQAVIAPRQQHVDQHVVELQQEAPPMGHACGGPAGCWGHAARDAAALRVPAGPRGNCRPRSAASASSACHAGGPGQRPPAVVRGCS